MRLIEKLCLTVLIGATLIPSAHALAFTDGKLPRPDGKKPDMDILFVYDCGVSAPKSLILNSPLTTQCSDAMQHISSGDAQTLENKLSQKDRSGRSYDEVWLYSGGGDLFEGIEIAKKLRQHHQVVRVPNGAYCVSACTVAFMGGYLRFVDPGATYEVHSASSAMHWSADPRSAWSKLIESAKQDPDKAFITFATSEQTGARYEALTILRLFQNTLLIPSRTHVPDDDDTIDRWAEGNAPSWSYRDDDNNLQRKADVQRYRSEGQACLQDIAMRIERDAMAGAINDLRAQLPDLGKRANYALEMISAMYMTSIMETSSLSHETMLKMGYITEEIGAQ